MDDEIDSDPYGYAPAQYQNTTTKYALSPSAEPDPDSLDEDDQETFDDPIPGATIPTRSRRIGGW